MWISIPVLARARVNVISADEFDILLQAPENQDRLLELVHGEVMEKVPTEAHGKLTALIAHFLLSFIMPHNIKAHVGVEVRHQTRDDQYNSGLPDVSVRLSDDPPVSSGVVTQMPDLAVEIQSPQDRPHQMRQKALFYLQKGARLVWLLYPEAHRAESCTLDESSNLLIEAVEQGGALNRGDVLPDIQPAH